MHEILTQKTDVASKDIERELSELRAMIERSGLYETDGHESASDSCGKPIFRKSGKRILVCRRRMELEHDRAKLMLQLGAKARRIAELESQLSGANQLSSIEDA